MEESMAPDRHPNDDYVNPVSPTALAPIPPEIFPSDLQSETGQSPEQGGTLSDGGSGGLPPFDESREGAGRSGAAAMVPPGATEEERQRYIDAAENQRAQEDDGGDLDRLTRDQLRALAVSSGVEGAASMGTKQELKDAILARREETASEGTTAESEQQ